MKRSKYSAEQVTFALRQHEAGTPAGDICRQLGVSEATLHNWKKKYAYLGVTKLRKQREENSRLKRLVADLTLDKQILSDAARKSLEAGQALATCSSTSCFAARAGRSIASASIGCIAWTACSCGCVYGESWMPGGRTTIGKGQMGPWGT